MDVRDPTIAVLHVLAVLLPSMIMIACSRVCNIMLHYGTFVVLRGVVVYGNCEECDVCCVVAVSTHSDGTGPCGLGLVLWVSPCSLWQQALAA